MDPTPEWQLPEIKPLNVKAGFLGGLAITVVTTGLAVITNIAPIGIAEVAAATLVPNVVLTLLSLRSSRRRSGRWSQ